LGPKLGPSSFSAAVALANDRASKRFFGNLEREWWACAQSSNYSLILLAFLPVPRVWLENTPREVARMKAVIAASLPNEFAAEFPHLIRRFDELHTGCTFQIVADAALPQDLRPVFESLAPLVPGR